MRRVRVLYANDTSPHRSGEIIELDEPEAAAMVGVGHVEYVDEPAVEAAVQLQPETTATRTHRPGPITRPAGRRKKR